MIDFDYGKWRDIMKKEIGEYWYIDSNVAIAVEQKFPYPWSLLSEEGKRIYKEEYPNILKRRAKEKQEKLVRSNIPEKFFNFDKYYSHADGIKESKFLLLKGETGTNKTALVCSFVNKFIDDNFIFYYLANEFQSDCEDRIMINEIYLYEYAKKVDILILDDLGTEHVRFRNYVIDIIKWRIDSELQTIYITNLNACDFEKKYPLISKRIEKKLITVLST